MNSGSSARSGFTLLELLLSISIVAVLAALILTSVRTMTTKSRRVTCGNQLRQINLATRMYADDSQDALPVPHDSVIATNSSARFFGYKALIMDYLGHGEFISSSAEVFACPADRFFPSFVHTDTHPARNLRQGLNTLPIFYYSSYVFNGNTNRFRSNGKEWWKEVGLGGKTLATIKNASRTVLLAEASAIVPWSWHDPIPNELQYPDAKNMLSYLDGHVSYSKIYWMNRRFPSGSFSFAINYNPPDEYDYQWSEE